MSVNILNKNQRLLLAESREVRLYFNILIVFKDTYKRCISSLHVSENVSVLYSPEFTEAIDSGYFGDV